MTSAPVISEGFSDLVNAVAVQWDDARRRFRMQWIMAILRIIVSTKIRSGRNRLGQSIVPSLSSEVVG